MKFWNEILVSRAKRFDQTIEYQIICWNSFRWGVRVAWRFYNLVFVLFARVRALRFVFREGPTTSKEQPSTAQRSLMIVAAKGVLRVPLQVAVATVSLTGVLSQNCMIGIHEYLYTIGCVWWTAPKKQLPYFYKVFREGVH